MTQIVCYKNLAYENTYESNIQFLIKYRKNATFNSPMWLKNNA